MRLNVIIWLIICNCVLKSNFIYGKKSQESLEKIYMFPGSNHFKITRKPFNAKQDTSIEQQYK